MTSVCMARLLFQVSYRVWGGMGAPRTDRPKSTLVEDAPSMLRSEGCCRSTLIAVMDIVALNENFGLPGLLTFEESNGLTCAVVTTPAASATIYFQGAHLTHWQPAGEESVLFLSGKSAFQKGKAIRGGVPVIFPWFGDRHDGQPGPAHGFARTAEWE